MKETKSIKVDARVVRKVKKYASKTKQTIGGIFELGAEAIMSVDQKMIEWKEKAERWDALEQEVSDVYLSTPEADLEDVGRFIIDKFGI